MSVHWETQHEDFGRVLSLLAIDDHAVRGNAFGRVEDDQIVYETVGEGIRVLPTLRLTMFEAERLYTALAKVFERPAPASHEREDYLHERARVDKFLDVLMSGRASIVAPLPKAKEEGS